jgi:hypothetical protein
VIKKWWYWFETYCIPLWMWRWYDRVRHPVRNWQRWRYMRAIPKPGEYAMYHDEGPWLVISVSDGDLEFENGRVGDWMNCCDPAPKGWTP